MQRRTFPNRFPPSILLLLLGLLVFWTKDFTIANDMAWYMNSALNIVQGKGYTDIDGSLMLFRGPMFSIMLAASYCVLGVSVQSAFWVVRIFCILNPIMIYLLGRKWFGRWVGLGAALLALTSYGINYWSYRHLDAVWPFFALLSIYLCCLSFEQESSWLSLGAGLTLGVAFLTKEMAIVLLPLPALLWLLRKEFRSRKNGVYPVLYLLGFLVVIAPWMMHIYASPTGFSGLRSVASFVLKSLSALEHGTNDSRPLMLSGATAYLKGIYLFYGSTGQSLRQWFLIAPLIVLSWFIVVFRALLGRKNEVVLSICLLLLSPVLSVIGAINWRVGQALLFLLLSCLVVVHMVLLSSRWLLEKIMSFRWTSLDRRAHSRIVGLGATWVVFGLLSVQLFAHSQNDRGGMRFLQRSALLAKLSGDEKPGRETGSYFDSRTKEMILKLSRLIPAGARVMFDDLVMGRAFYFRTSGEYAVFSLPILEISLSDGFNEMPGFNYEVKPPAADRRIVFISSRPGSLGPLIQILYEDALLNAIRQRDLQYVVLLNKKVLLTPYFSNTRSFQLVARSPGRAAEVYRILAAEPAASLDLVLSERASSILAVLKRDDPEKYLDFHRKYLDKGKTAAMDIRIVPLGVNTPGRTLKGASCLATGSLVEGSAKGTGRPSVGQGVQCGDA